MINIVLQIYKHRQKERVNMLGLGKKYIDAMHAQATWPVLLVVWFLSGGDKFDGVWWWLISVGFLLWPIKEEVSQRGVLMVFIAAILFYEEMVLAPLKKFVLPGVGWVVKITPAWLIFVIFVVSEFLKNSAKFLFFVALAYGIIPALLFVIGYITISIINFQILIHGTEKMRTIWLFDVAYLWIVRTFGPYKKRVKDWFNSLGIVRYWNELKERAEEEGDSLIGQLWRDARKRADTYREKSQDDMLS